MILVFNHDKGWRALKDDIKTFCKVLQFEPNDQQMHYLLRVQNAGSGPCRMGLLPMPGMDAFGIVAASLLYRAMVYEIPSYLFYEHRYLAEKWVNSLALWGVNSIEPLRSQLQVSKQRRFLLANNIHVCHIVGPWTSDARFKPGKQDIVLPNFDTMPTPRIRRICDLTVGSILYVPHNGTLVEPKDRRKTPHG